MSSQDKPSLASKLCVALDVDTLEEVESLLKELNGVGCLVKVGKQLFTRFGPKVIDVIHQQGFQVFLDLKFHDIPNTVKKACRAAADMDVFMINVHASGGSQMMQAAREGVAESKSPQTKLLGVTVLTSLTEEVLQQELKVTGQLSEHVTHLASLAQSSGLNGVVASPHEISLVRKSCGQDFIILTPGVRPAGSESEDQKRVMTPRQAIDEGADYIVIGRPITQSPHPRQVAEDVLQALSGS